MKCPQCYEYLDEIKKLKQEIMRLKNVDVYGWQGKDKLGFILEGMNWKITEHRKDKETGIVAQQTHVIPEMNVVDVWELIKRRVNVGEKTRYREIVADLILTKHLPVSIEEFNGGLNRSKFLFPLYYYPMKILEHKGYIKYGGRGTIVRLKC